MPKTLAKFERSDGKVTVAITPLQWVWSGIGANQSYTMPPAGAALAIKAYTDPGTYWPDLPAFAESERILPGLTANNSRPIYAACPGDDYVTSNNYHQPR